MPTPNVRKFRITRGDGPLTAAARALLRALNREDPASLGHMLMLGYHLATIRQADPDPEAARRRLLTPRQWRAMQQFARARAARTEATR